MTEAERFKIISEEYADLIVKYDEDLELLDIYPASSRLIINRQYAIVYIPANRFTDSAIAEFSYASIPTVYGLTSEASLNASGVTDLRNIPNLNLRGEGTLIGIVDTGIDYTNPVFQHSDGGTRIVALWDQTIDSGNYPEGMFYGTEYTRDQINEAINSSNPFEIVPSVDEDGHGTMIAGIAAGNESPENNFYGIATMAELVVVKLKPAKNFIRKFFRIPDSALCYQENDILAGVQFLINVARRERKPIAICIALGSSLTSHDGRDFLSDYLSTQGTSVGTAITIAAGNEGNSRRHYFGSVSSGQNFDTVELNVGENENDFSMELWGSGIGIFSIDILSPSGEFIPRITGGIRGRREIRFLFERTVINIDYMINELQSGDPLILIRFTDPAQGIWRFRVYNAVDFEASFHIWLPMGNFISNNTFFLNPDPNTTILSPANACVPMCVTSYNTVNQALYINASRGYTRFEFVAPDFAAPGVNITAPTLDHGFTSVTGTGVAAAHTTGIAALFLEWGILGGRLPRMNTWTIKLLLIRGAERNTREGYPNRNWGYGILNIYNTFQVIRGAIDTSFF